MIKSNQILKICEDYLKSIKVYGIKVDIYENPGSSDLVKICKSTVSSVKAIRFIANAKSSKVYVWIADSAIHDAVLKDLGLGSYVDKKPYILAGNGDILGGKIVLSRKKYSIAGLSNFVDYMYQFYSRPVLKSDNIEERNWLSEMFKLDWSFLDRYISGVTQYINNEKKRFEEWSNRYDKK